MGRQNEADIEAEKQKRAAKHTAQFGKPLGAQPDTEEERRQQALAMLRKKAQAKRDGKRVVADKSVVVGAPKQAKGDGKRLVAGDSVTDAAPMQAPPKRARAPRKSSVEAVVLEKTSNRADNTFAHTMKAVAQSKRAPDPVQEVVEDLNQLNKEARAREKKQGKKPMVEESEGEKDEASSNDELAEPNSKFYMRDRSKTPTEEELLELLREGIAWVPTRFVDRKILQVMNLAEDVEAMLHHMKVGSLYSAAYPTHKGVSCQFLATLEATFHTSKHAQQGWGEIRFKIEGEMYSMSFQEIGEVFDLEDQKNPSLPKFKTAPKEKSIAGSMWTLLTGQEKAGKKKEKNGAIRHPTMRYLHRLLNHTLFQKKEVGNVAGDELRFLHQGARHFASYPQLPRVPDDFYSDFGMVGFLVKRLMHYKSWAWTNRDSGPQLGIGGWITPLLFYHGIDLGDDGVGPIFLDGAYLRRAQFLGGRLASDGRLVYSYSRNGKQAELLLPSPQLTPLSISGGISFDISEEHLLKSHGPLCPVNLPKCGVTTSRKKKLPYEEEYIKSTTAHLFGPPRYKLEQCTSVLPLGPLRQAHDQIRVLQRWNKAQDRTIFKLTNKCKELKRTVKRQAEISARLLKKVADVLTRGAVAGCKAEDFDLDAFNAPPPPPRQPSEPRTEKQAQRRLRNPYIAPSTSGNKSPSLSTTADEDDSESEASASSHAP